MMEESLSYSSEVKKGLIGLLMFTLYSDEKTIYREYVQNSLDSINSAVEKHILAQAKDGVVNIDIDVKNKSIVIRDNGTGINVENAVRTLLDISASTKDGVNQAGQFGIGRLVGGGYCHELIFRTTAKGESLGTEIKFDVDKIWHLVKEDPTEYLATFVIDTCTSKQHFQAKEEEHYFEVTLNGVKDDSAPTLLNKEEVIKYLNAIAPVGYKSQFNNVLIHNQKSNNPEFRQLHDGIEKIQLFVGDVRILKQYELSIKGTNDAINNLEYFKIEDESFGLLGWGWFALTKYTIQIPADDNLACIRLRKHNIQIGDSNQLSGNTYWKETRSNSYFYGEFFVTHPNIVPNAARDGLAPTPETNVLHTKLREYFDSLKNLYTKANEAKKSIDKIKDGIVRLKNTKDPNDYSAKDLIENKGIGKFDKLVKNATFGPTQRMLELYRSAYEEAKLDAEATRKALTPKQTQPQPSTLQPNNGIFDISQTRITSATEPKNATVPSIVNEHNSAAAPLGNNYTPNTGNLYGHVIDTNSPVETHGGGNISPATSIQLDQPYLLAHLESVLKRNELFIIQRVFRVLNMYCPKNEHDQKLITEMQALIVKDFENDKK